MGYLSIDVGTSSEHFMVEHDGKQLRGRNEIFGGILDIRAYNDQISATCAVNSRI